MDFYDKLKRLEQQGIFTSRQGQILRQFYHSYLEALREKGTPHTQSPAITLQFLDLIAKQIQTPYPFALCHNKTTEPFNYFTFGMEIIRPLIALQKSLLLGTDNLARINAQLKQKHNCVFFANHQTETDPQAINLMVEESYPEFGANILFVAGHRVITDPIAVPFSQGRDLLCIYSRKHMDDSPEHKANQQQHNRRAMRELVRKLALGGLSVYIAPSGGRDRPNAQGAVEVSPFDKDAIDLFALMAQESKTPTHFYPLSLVTHRLLPPPPVVEKELGEDREFHYTPIGLAFGEELDMTHGSDQPGLDKKAFRQVRRDYIYQKVCDGYQQLKEAMQK